MSWSKDEGSLSYIMSILTSLTIFAVSNNEGLPVLPLPCDRRLRISGRVATHVRALLSISPAFYVRFFRTKVSRAGFLYRRTSLYAVFLSAVSHMYNWKFAFYQELIHYFIVILGLFICKFIIFEPHFLVPISHI